MRVVALVHVGLILAAVSRAGLAQASRVIRGTVLDARDQPVTSAAVIVIGAAGTITDDSGRFRLDLPHQDKISFDVRRVGFMPSRVGVASGGDTTVSVLMLPAVQQLGGIAVTAPATKPPALAGFEQRMRDRERGAGSGRFITAQEIARMGVNRTTSILANENSLTVRRVGLDRYAIFGKTTTGAGCNATLFLDGIRLSWGGQVIRDRRGRAIGREPGAPIDEYVQPTEIAGIEVYARSMLAPPQFQPPTSDSPLGCAVVVVWTKHG